MIFYGMLKDMHMVFVETLTNEMVPFQSNMSQATSHCLKYIYVPSVEVG